jgi:predicted dehydrogenase
MLRWGIIGASVIADVRMAPAIREATKATSRGGQFRRTLRQQRFRSLRQPGHAVGHGYPGTRADRQLARPLRRNEMKGE